MSCVKEGARRRAMTSDARTRTQTRAICEPNRPALTRSAAHAFVGHEVVAEFAVAGARFTSTLAPGRKVDFGEVDVAFPVGVDQRQIQPIGERQGVAIKLGTPDYERLRGITAECEGVGERMRRRAPGPGQSTLPRHDDIAPSR